MTYIELCTTPCKHTIHTAVYYTMQGIPHWSHPLGSQDSKTWQQTGHRPADWTCLEPEREHVFGLTCSGHTHTHTHPAVSMSTVGFRYKYILFLWRHPTASQPALCSLWEASVRRKERRRWLERGRGRLEDGGGGARE